MNLRIDLPGWIILSYLFILGTIVGSFVNVCICRIPPHDRLRDQLRSLWNRPSQCPRCRSNIRWFDNIPLIGWLRLRGRCRQCRMRISPRYPLIELLSGCLWVLVFVREVPFGIHGELEQSCLFTNLGPQNYPGLGPFSPEAFVLIRYVYHMVLIEALLVASVIDLDLRIIPDGSTVPATIVGVATSLIIARVNLVPVWFQTENHLASYGAVVPAWLHPFLDGPSVPEWITRWPHLHGLVVSLAGLVVGGGLVWLVRLAGFWLLRQEAMGFGDVILMAMIGSFLGWQGTVIAFFIAPVCAMGVVAVTTGWNLLQRWLGRPHSFDRLIPYGPYLSLGALVTLLFWSQLFEGSRHVFELGVLLLPIVGLMMFLFALSLLIVQGIKWMLGIRTPESVTATWRAADQLWYFQGEKVQRHTGRWQTKDWEGCASGHGTLFEERWKRCNGAGRKWGPRSK